MQASLRNDTIATVNILLSHMQFAIWVAEKECERTEKLSLLSNSNMQRPARWRMARGSIPKPPYEQLLPLP